MEKVLMQQTPHTPNVKHVSHSVMKESLMTADTPHELEQIIAYCARVSNPDNQHNHQTADRLIKYLIRHKHWSPFELVNVCLEINTTRDIARQILRHRSFTFQEFSQRYANPVDELSFSLREPRYQDEKNRQNSINLGTSLEEAKLEDEWYNKQLGMIEYAKMTYQWAIDNGIAKEVARAVLPEGLTSSRMYVNGTIRSWIHYIETRTDPSTQKEHRDIAVQCATVIADLFPSINNFLRQPHVETP
jgi:thymidylate synthase (FAD)